MADDFVPPWEQPASPTVSPAVVNQTLAVEGTGQNPNSSAVGPGQFINSTALDMVKRYRPDVAYGKSDADILATRTDPNYAPMWRDMTNVYASENSEKLSAAGLQPSAGNVYLAHFLGPGGALRVLKSDPTTPVSQLLDPAAIKANPQIANMTAGDIQSWAAGKMRVSVGRTPQQGMAGQPSPESVGYTAPWETAQTTDQRPTGLVTQLASGMMEGIQNLPGTIPRVAALAGQGINYLTGNKEAQVEDAQRAALAQSIQKNMPSVTNLLPQPANPQEQYARTAGNFIPGAIAGPGGISRVITQGVVPGLTSEAAGQVFKETPYEAEARAISPVLSGLRGGAASERASVAVPTTEELRAIARGPGGYEAAKTGPIFQPTQMDQLASDINSAMKEGGSRDYIAPGVFRAIDELKGENSVEGIQKVRSLVGGIGERGDREAKYAAKMAKDEIDKFLQTNAPEQATTLEAARGNDAAAFRSEKIENATSGKNIDAARRAVGALVKKYENGKKQGFNEDEYEAMRDFSEGNTKSGLLRVGGMFAPEKGPLGLGVAGELASKITESVPKIAAITAGLSYLGRAANKLRDMQGAGQLNKLTELIRKRSPAYKAAVEAAGNRYADSMDAFAATPNHENFIRFVVASRNLANGFKRDGINISSGDLLRQFSPVPAGANEQQQQQQ